MIEVLKDQGCQTVLETAKGFIDGLIVKGRTLDEMRQNEAALQRKLLDRI